MGAQNTYSLIYLFTYLPVSMYELTYIISPVSAELDTNAVAAKVRSFITGQMAGTVKKEYITDKKRLSYPIKKQSGGFYVAVEFSAEPEKMDELKKFLGLENDILRHLLIDIKNGIPAKRPARIKPAAVAASGETAAKAPKVKIEELDKRLEELLK